MAFVPGIDISEHQRAVDGQALANAGIRHAVVRCADAITHRLDHFYLRNVESLRAAGIPTDTYVYVRPSLEDPESAAERYAGWANTVEQPGRLWLDFEGDPGLGPMDLALWSLEVVARLELDGWAGHLGIYTNTWWDGHVDRRADELARLPLWHASYPFSERPPPADPGDWEEWVAGRPPRIARPWRDINADWVIWQFTSSGTLVLGHRLDCNLVDPVLLDKEKPKPTPEDDVWICVPKWSKATDPAGLRWQFYSFDGALFSAWNGAPVPADAGFVKNQFLPCVTVDLTNALAGQKASQPVTLNAGRLVGVYRQDGAPFFWATGQQDPDPPVAPPAAIDFDFITRTVRQDIAGRLTT